MKLGLVGEPCPLATALLYFFCPIPTALFLPPSFYCPTVMTSRILLFIAFWLGLLLAFDIYVFNSIRAISRDQSIEFRRWLSIGYWGVSVLMVLGLLLFIRLAQNPDAGVLKAVLSGFFFANLVFKIFASFFLSIDDLRRLIFWLAAALGRATGTEALVGLPISRSDFMAKAALLIAAVPAIGMAYGVARGGHRYQIRRHTIGMPNLPSEFEGLKIVQISDIHSGSFFNRAGVRRGVELILKEKPDIIFFTGDLVNNIATEVEPFIEIFKELAAPMGVFSVLGNHDYGDYASWESPEQKRANLDRLKNNHKKLGWDLLNDEHRILERNGQQIAILGVQNWSARGNFPKYGNLSKAYVGSEAAPVKILLSHDPSHWLAEVTTKYKDIDLALAGHTHGMQFGIDSKVLKLKWSPVQYVYEQWAGLYTQGKQHLYVNRGFGFIGYPGRLGIWPEITVLTLSKNHTVEEA